MDVKVRRRAVVLALSVPGRLCRCTVSRTAQTVGCDTQWQGENHRDIATLQRSAAFKTLASPLLEGHERAQQPSPPDIVWALSTAAFAARCLHVGFDLGVADHIGDQPVRIGELASSCGVDPDGLDRVLRVYSRPMAASSASTAATATRPHHSCCAAIIP